MKGKSQHAIVFGASSLIGWAVIDQLLRCYPQVGAFSKITAVTNRPIKLSECYWPEPGMNRPILQLVSGVDLRDGDGVTLSRTLKQVVKDIDTVTHLFYQVFASVPEDIEEVAVNGHMFQAVITAHNLLCPNLQFVIFPGGTRGYGIYTAGGIFTPPLTETMVNNLPCDYAKTLVYLAYREMLTAASEQKNWTWCEVCPDAIIGFTPNGSQFSLALHWAQYLSLYAHNHGVELTSKKAGTSAVKVAFPGSTAGANSLFSPVSATTLARFMIYASLHPDICGGGQLFNIADSEVPCTYGELWPRLTNWFGLVGTGPVEDSTIDQSSLAVGELPEAARAPKPGEYIARHKTVFSQCGNEKAIDRGVSAGCRQLDSVGYWLTFDRHLSLKKLRETGFKADRDPIEGWIESFEMFRKAELIL
ncbi:hypothetical protein F5B22DRAFT_621895 [Xylaria bambusicola]|uniref:uncharacterized protein n=1 Tax=Xylaria bambusicola TaxID=326684 RepID=UPI002008C24D|nr:uncharacterized protein F5B22DRAFT_621895 [Xylaria bambusicola]KAI0506926.1 hypothetical protein F5B22DRAFT_621895 [Xylaria bambusicola]